MARPTTSGLPYLVCRKDGGKYTYWRAFNKTLAPFIAGSLRRSWAVTDLALTGKPIAKISLKTGDLKIARDRWSEVHAQIEDMLRYATWQTKPSGVTQAANYKETVTDQDMSIIAGQAKHDLLAANDRAWVNPGELPSPLARGLSAALQMRQEVGSKDMVKSELLEELLRLSGASILIGRSDLLKYLEQFSGDFSAQQIRDWARDKEAAEISQMLKTGSNFPLDGPNGTLEELRLISDGSVPKIQVVSTAAIRSELTQRLNENGISLSEGSKERRELALKVLRAKAIGYRELAARAEGEAIETPPRPALVVDLSSDTGALPTLRKLHDIWVGRERPGRKAVDDNKLYVQRFIALHGDLRADQITRAHVRRYRDMLTQFPRAMTAQLVGKTPDEIMAWTAARPDLRRLSRVTVNAKGIGSISTLMEIAIADYDVESNPCRRLALPIKQAADRVDRLPFDDDDLKRLLASPVYQNPSRIQKAGAGAAAFWLPLIALFTGARQEEIGQLLTADVKHAGEIAYFDITTLESADDDSLVSSSHNKMARQVSADKSAKTVAAIRQVPIHRVLIEIGFLDYVTRRKKNNDRRLFPLLKAYRGRWTKNWSRWWARYQDKHISNIREKVFHSFRHRFIDAMRAARIAKEHQKPLIGHSREDVTDEYGLGYPITLLNDEIQKISYSGVDFSNLATVAKTIT